MITYDHAKYLAGTGLDLTGDVRLCLVMSNTTSRTERRGTSMADFSVLDEYDGAGYSPGGIPLSGRTWSEDNVAHAGVLDSDDPLFQGLGIGSRECVGAIAYLWQSSFATSIPLCQFDDPPDFPFSGLGTDATFQVNVQGLLRIA